MTNPPALTPVEAEILRLTDARGPDRSICPSEVARQLLPDGKWQAMMPAIRRAAAGLARAGLIDILRHGKPIDPDAMRGVIRLRVAPKTRPIAPE